jgi:proline dehydrogenase
MLGAASKALFHILAGSTSLKHLATRYGMGESGSFVRRFIAGETVEEAIEAARLVESQHLHQTLDYLGESSATAIEADGATREYRAIIDKVAQSGVERNLSLKLTQLGLDVDRATCTDNLRRILEPAEQQQFFIRIDMENSSYTGLTLDIFETIWRQGSRGLGVVLQSCLRRSDDDLNRINALGARIRLVKGAYKEPKAVAVQTKAEVDAAYVRMMRILLESGTYPALATHDPAMIDEARRFATERGIASNRFEFQMLFGIRRDLQTALTNAGYRVRVYIPFGREWYPYFMRRLGERPANVGFVLRGILGERN